MPTKQQLKSLAIAVSTALATSLGAIASASADQNPFTVEELSSGYLVAGAEGKCGEGKCGDDKGEEGKCGEGKCGGDKGGEGKCSEGKYGG